MYEFIFSYVEELAKTEIPLLAEKPITSDLKELEKLISVILSKPQIAVTTGKQMFYKQLQTNMEEAYEYASKIMACNMMDRDVEDSVKTFLKKND